MLTLSYLSASFLLKKTKENASNLTNEFFYYNFNKKINKNFHVNLFVKFGVYLRQNNFFLFPVK